MSQAVVTHPGSDRLAAFSWGKLDAAEAAEVAEHLVACTDCQTVVERQPDDPLMALLRKALATPAESGTSSLTGSWVPAELVGHPRYRLLRWLGAGGMGVVYQAEHRLMERVVALKVINNTLTADTAAVERFQKEVKAAAKLSHPNIVAAYDADQAGDRHFLVMEFVEGRSLARVVEDRGPLPVEAACECIRQAALGLQHAFECGMVHRDMKPENLMQTVRGQVKVLDFGLAGFVSGGGPVGSLTEFGKGLGTPDYVAPEQIRDAHAADIRADVYGLGCTLYYLLTGQPPFPGGSAAEKIAAHLERTPRPLCQLRSDVPEGLAKVVERMMTKDPANRYQTPAAVVEALGPVALVEHARRTAKKEWLPCAALGAVVIAVGLAVAIPRLGSGNAPPDRGSGRKAPKVVDEQGQAKESPRPGSDPPGSEQTRSTEKEGPGRDSPDKKIESRKVSAEDSEGFLK